jgi:hypothetical protein
MFNSDDLITIIVPRELPLRMVVATIHATFPHTDEIAFRAFMRFDHSRPCWLHRTGEDYR